MKLIRKNVLIVLLIVHLALFFGLFFGGGLHGWLDASDAPGALWETMTVLQAFSILFLIFNCLIAVLLLVLFLWFDHYVGYKVMFLVTAICVLDIIFLVVLIAELKAYENGIQSIVHATSSSLNQLLPGAGSTFSSSMSGSLSEVFSKIRSFQISLLWMNILGVLAFGACTLQLKKAAMDDTNTVDLE